MLGRGRGGLIGLFKKTVSKRNPLKRARKDGPSSLGSLTLIKKILMMMKDACLTRGKGGSRQPTPNYQDLAQGKGKFPTEDVANEVNNLHFGSLFNGMETHESSCLLLHIFGLRDGQAPEY